MRKRGEHLISYWINQSRHSLRGNPVEAFLIAIFVIFGIAGYGWVDHSTDLLLGYGPLLFIITHLLNDWTVHGRYRLLYYLSALLPILTFLIASPRWLWQIPWFVAMCITLLLYWQVGSYRQDVVFMRRFLSSARAFILALFLSGITYLLLISIYASIQYLFGAFLIGTDYFYTYVGILVWAGIFPLLLLIFDREEKREGDYRILEILYRFVLSPVLLIYTLLFYAYMGKILLTGSLPKGGVCYLVAIFVTVAFFLKGIIPFLPKTTFSWFYDRLAWLILPPLILYAISASYRINQYGWTVMRVYLALAGVVMGILWLTTIIRRSGTFFYTAWSAIILLVLVTYIPGITAEEIERASQAARDNNSTSDKRHPASEFIMLRDQGNHDVSEYHYFRALEVWENDSTIMCGIGDSVWINLDKESLLRGQYEKAGVESSTFPADSLHASILCLKSDSSMLLFEQMRLIWDQEKQEPQISWVGQAHYFWK